MIHEIGAVTKAEQEREGCRILMRESKTAKDHARYKRLFRKARNRALWLKE